MPSKIQWTNETWNPIRGCRRTSRGCENCYAERQAIRIPGYREQGIIKSTSKGPRWTGETSMAPEHILSAPLRWKKPRMVFVNSMADLFFERPFDEIAAVFGIMAACPQHTFQVLTKYAERMAEFFEWLREEADWEESGPYQTPNGWGERETIHAAARRLIKNLPASESDAGWPLKNVWLGVSVEHQEAADERIPLLLRCPAAVRWISAEPLLGPVELGEDALFGRFERCPFEDYENHTHCAECRARRLHRSSVCWAVRGPSLDWVVCGGESGHGARPMDAAWARSLRGQCVEADIPFFFKQWGAHNEVGERVGKKAAGRLLDGVLWDQFPRQADGGAS